MTRVRIEPVEAGGIGELLPLWQENMAYHAELTPLFHPAPNGSEYWRNWAAVALAAGQGAAFAARAGGVPAGFIFGHTQTAPPIFQPARIGCISDLYVRPEHRRHGLGRLLFLEMADWFRDQGVDFVELQAYEANKEAMAFWLAMGSVEYAKRMRIALPLRASPLSR